MRGMNLSDAMGLHDAFYHLHSEDPYGDRPYEFPQEFPFRDYDAISDGEDDE